MEDVRIGILGVGSIGLDHARRISQRINGAVLSAVADYDAARAEQVGQEFGVRAARDLEELASGEGIDALMLCSPGFAHKEALLQALDLGLPAFTEKPLTPDSVSAEEVLAAEQRLDRPHIQVGFMRRFDAEYRALRDLVESGQQGELLMVHAAHRNARPTNPHYTQQNLIDDSVVHEFDVLSWLAGSPITSVAVRQGRRNSLTLAHLHDPILVLIELENGVLIDVEMNVSAQFGYQVTTEAVFERGVARIGQPSGMEVWSDARCTIAEHEYYDTRFHQAFDTEVQQWVDAVRDGRLVDGPTAWDGYRVALACEAGVEALRSGREVAVDAGEKPEFYSSDES